AAAAGGRFFLRFLDAGRFGPLAAACGGSAAPTGGRGVGGFGSGAADADDLGGCAGGLFGAVAGAPDQDADPEREDEGGNGGDHRSVGREKASATGGRRHRLDLLGARATRHLHVVDRVHDRESGVAATLPAVQAVALVGRERGAATGAGV